MAQPLKWYGGKYYLAPWIIENFPSHLHYVEPFFGGGSVLFQKPDDLIDGHSEVVNDINGGLMNFWQVLRCQFQEMQRLLELTPFAQLEWQRSFEVIDGDDVGNAVRFFTRYRQSRQGLGKGFETLVRNRIKRGMNENVSAWLSTIDGLPKAHARLQRVVILNDDATKIIKQQDGAHTFVYCDPPYLHETRVATNAYDHEMTLDQHKTLLVALENMIGMFMLSGYRSRLYDDWAKRYGFQRLEKIIDNKASSAKIKEKKTECLWINYRLGD